MSDREELEQEQRIRALREEYWAEYNAQRNLDAEESLARAELDRLRTTRWAADE